MEKHIREEIHAGCEAARKAHEQILASCAGSAHAEVLAACVAAAVITTTMARLAAAADEQREYAELAYGVLAKLGPISGAAGDLYEDAALAVVDDLWLQRRNKRHG